MARGLGGAAAQRKGDAAPYVRAVYRMAHAIVRRVDNPLLMSDTLFFLTRMGAEWRADLRTLHGPRRAATPVATPYQAHR
jgi:hypothetical protein